MFQLKRKNVDMIKPKYKRPRAVSHEDLRTVHEPKSQTPPSKLPFLLELHPGMYYKHYTALCSHFCMFCSDEKSLVIVTLVPSAF